MTRFSIRRPRATLALWAALMVVLSGTGIGLEDRLSEGFYLLDDSDSGRTEQLDRASFGTRELTPVLLRGPADSLDRQGPDLAATLRGRYHVLSAWDGDARSRQLRPSATSGVLLVDLGFDPQDRTKQRLAPLKSAIDGRVGGDVTAQISGNNAAAGAVNQAAVDSSKKAELIAFPVLLLVLLLVFRSPVAAAVPAIVGVATTSASTGVISLGANFTDLTGTSVSIAGMMGLALGVDYSLLIVSRFREELRAGALPADAAATAARTAGRTVIFAGAVLLVAMAIAVALSPGSILVSVAAGVVTAAGLSLLAAMTAVAASLTLIGARIDSFAVPLPSGRSGLLAQTASWAMRRPLVVGGVLLVGLLALSAPALSISTAPPNLLQLPSDNNARVDFESFRKELGPGFVNPFKIVVHAPSGRVDDPRYAGALAAFSRRLASQDGVVAVIAPQRRSRSGTRTEIQRSGDRILVNENAGSSSARVFVVSQYFGSTDGNVRLRDNFAEASRALAKQTGLDVSVGGLGAQFVDYQRAASSYLPVLIAALTIATYLLLVVILRAVVLPAAALLLNLLVVGAGFGALELFFQGDNPPLGGPGFVDVISVSAIFTILFSLSVDYEIFLLTRMREAFLIDGDARAAVLHGIEKTGNVVTGAALIMTAVFLSFAASTFITPRQFGIGLAVAVVIDATLLRLLLLPAAMRALGDLSWWCPAWIDRRLPRLDIEGSQQRASGGSPILVPNPTRSVKT